MVREDSTGFPIEIVHSDHSGAFGWYECPLERFAEYYAHPVNDRESVVPDPRDFARLYLDAFRAQFERIRDDYLRRRGAFDQLFSNRRVDPQGSFAYRWSVVLKRLLDTDLDALVAAIRSYIAGEARNAGARPSGPR